MVSYTSVNIAVKHHVITSTNVDIITNWTLRITFYPLNDWVIFFQNVILFPNVVHHKCNIFYMKLVQYNECLINIVDADGLVL